MAKVKVIRRGRLTTEERQRGSRFSLGTAPAPLPSYDALRDGNLRQYFESKTVQKFLQGSGWIDKEGRIVDLDKFRSAPSHDSNPAAVRVCTRLASAIKTLSCPLSRRGAHMAKGLKPMQTLSNFFAPYGHVSWS